MKNNKKTLIKGIILLMLVAIIGTTYAYFAANIIGNESASTIVVTGGTMEIVYDNLSGTIEAYDIYPRENAWVTKNFTVTGNNSTTKDMKYKLALKVDKNTFSSGALTYSLTSVNTSNKGTIVASKTNQVISGSEVKFGTGSFPKGEDMVHTYTFELFFKDTGENQNIDQGKQFAGYITIKESPFNEIALSKSNLSSIGYTDNEVPATLVIPEKYQTSNGEWNQVTSIAGSAFSVNNTLTSLTLNEGLESIGRYAFQNTTNLTGTLIIPSTVKTIEYSAFYKTGITGLTLNEGLESIGDNAFYEATNLTGTPTIPSTVKTIEEYVFRETGITGLTLNEGLESIGRYAFHSAANLTGHITIPSTVKTIGEHAFYKTGITGLTLNEGLETIGPSAFMKATNLTGSIIIPSTVKTIEGSAFYKTGITTINYPGTEAQWNQISKGSNAFPSGVTINYNYIGA